MELPFGTSSIHRV